MNDAEKRIIVIGSEGHYGVKTVPWDTQDMPNIADYDNVIIDTSSFDHILEQARNDKTYRDNNEELLRRIHGNLEFAKERLVHLLHSNGDIFAICSQSQWCSITAYTQCNNYQWSPLPINTVNESGETKPVVNDAFTHYFQFVREWSFYFKTEYNQSSLQAIRDFYRGKYIVEPKRSVIAENRYTKPLAIAVWYDLYKFENTRDLEIALKSISDATDYGGKLVLTSGKIFLLPPTTEIDRKEAINMLIEDFWGIQQKTLPPEGIAKILVPGEDLLQQEIEKRNVKIQNLTTEISDLEKRKEELTQFKQLIYETGIPLEDICKLTLSKLGCDIDDSVEDFILTKGDKEAITEVKGRTRTILREDGSQLAQNRRNYAVQKRKGVREVKAILLGNPWRLLLPLEERVKKDSFAAPHLINDAKTEEMALVTTVELFKAYCAFLEGKISSEEITERLFLGIGETKLVEE